MEQEIIDNDIFYGFKRVGGNIEKLNISLNDDLKSAYQNIFNYYKNKNNVPSLVYLDEKLKALYETFIDLFNKEIESIPENSILSSDPKKLDLLKLGLLKDRNHVLFSSLSPLNIAYQLEVSNQCGNELLEKNILERLIPNNLVPYIFGDGGLYRPVYQTDAHEWTVYERREEVSIGTTNAFIANVVTEKINQFISHFDYLFDLNNKAPIKLNIINITDDKEVVKGIFNFMKNRLLNNSNDGIIPVEINIYSDAESSSLDNFFECNTKEQIDAHYGIKIQSDKLDELEIIRLIQDNIVYYKHKKDVDGYEYAHISFYKSDSSGDIADDNMGQIETGLSLNGLMSSITSISNNLDYRVGFGIKNILDNSNYLVRTSINLNELCRNNVNKGNNTYSKRKTIITKPAELKEDLIENLYNQSHWVTFIEPNFGIEYFENLSDLIIIHYSDQYTSSSQYDTITVTNRSKQYENIIKNFLKNHNFDISEDELVALIKMFNSINGEWLLRTITYAGDYEREKLSIISAIKYALAILDHPEIVWIPISMEEILRIAGNIKLDKNEGIFSIKSLNEKGVHSDDLLFIGIHELKNNNIEVYYHPIEVKIGYNFSSTIEKGKNQLNNTYNLIKEQLNQNNTDHTFRNKFFRNFFVQILLSNEQKLSVNHVWDNKSFDKIRKLKSKLLNDDYVISYDLESIIGIGSLISFKKDNHFMSVNLEDKKQIIELTEEYAYSGLIESIEKIHNKVQSDNTDIPKSNLLSSVDLDKLDKVSYSEDIIGELSENNLSESGNFIDVENEVDVENVEYNGLDNNISVSKNECEDNVSGDIADPVIEPISEVPTSEISTSNLEDIRAYIGKVNNSNHEIFWEFGNPSLANRHMLIQGKSGQGKTYFIQRMLKEMSEQGVPSIIIDYTDGFKKSKLDDNFKLALDNDDKIQYCTVYVDRFPLNPFKKNLIEIDENTFVPEDNSTVASRFKSTISSVYNLGSQQLNVIYQSVIRGLEKYGSNMDLIKLKEELNLEDSSSAGTVLSQLNELLDKNPFISDDEFDWSILENHDGKVIIIQLTGLSRDIQKIVSELILWDLWNYKTQNGSENNPFVIVLDEAHNLDFDSKSPCGKILTEGRKFGWSGWFATQSLKGSMKSDEISRFENADEKIFFHPTDDSVSYIAGTFTNNNSDKKDWEQKLLKLNKGQCVVYGSILNESKELISSNPVYVDIAPINKNFDNKCSDLFGSENSSSIEDSSNLDRNTKNIYQHGKYYNISKSIGGKNCSFGYYKTLEEAIKVRDELELNEWDKTKVNVDFNQGRRKSKYGKYISKIGNYFTINKSIDGNLKNFGYYKSLKEATEARDHFVDNGWDYDHIPKKLSKRNRNISKSKNGYTVNKRIDGELKCFGEFETLDDAREVRNELELNNWFENNNSNFSSEEKYDEYVFFKEGKYYIKNDINGNLRIFGIFDDPSNAIDARNECIKKNWDLKSIEENKISENTNFSWDV